MSEKNEISGRWWIGGPSAAPVGGILSTDRRLELKIVIPIGTPAAEAYSHRGQQGLPKMPEVLHGRDSQDKPVVLYGCSCHSHSTASGEEVFEISALAGVQGLEITSWQVPAVRTVTIRLQHLHRWLHTDYLKSVQLPDGKTAYVAKDYSEEQFAITDGVECRLIQSSKESHGQDRDLFTPDCRVAITFATPQSLEEACGKWVNWIAHFFSLLAGTNLRTEEITVSDLDLFEKRDFVEAALAFSTNQAKVLGRAQSKGRVRLSDPNMYDMPAAYSSVKGQLGAMLQKWHEVSKRLHALVSLFTAVVFHHRLYSSAEFLFLVQALEVYHTRSGHFESRQLPKEELLKRIDEVMKVVPVEHAEWVKEKLSSNHKHLDDRILEVFQAYQSTAELAFKDLKDTAEKMAYTRNHYTHYNGKPDHRKFLDEDAIARLNFSLEHFLWAILLKELGAPTAALDTIMSFVKSAFFTSLKPSDKAAEVSFNKSPLETKNLLIADQSMEPDPPVCTH